MKWKTDFTIQKKMLPRLIQINRPCMWRVIIGGMGGMRDRASLLCGVGAYQAALCQQCV
jgi:hypothetical protein